MPPGCDIWTIVYLQRLKDTLEQEVVLVTKQLQIKEQRVKQLEVHYANLILYCKLGVM